MTLKILLSTPDVGELEERYVARAIRSGWAAPAGPDLVAFEEEVARRVGVQHCVGLSSGTAALHLALVSLGVGPGDTVPVSTLTFAASVNAIRYVGATPHLVDSEPESGNMDPTLLAEAMVTIRRQRKSRVPVVMPVDLLGKSADYTVIQDVLADFPDTHIVSDAAEAFGATHHGRAAGSFGHVSALSFNGNKIMTTSGGGMLLTDDGPLASHARSLASQARQPAAHYEHTELGYNYRLSNLLAALGRAQLERLDDMISRRRRWRKGYRQLFAGRPGVRILGGADDKEDNCWLTAIIVDPSASEWTAQELGDHLREAGIETRPIWKPMHMQPVNVGIAGTINGTSEWLFAHGLTLPSGSVMKDAEFEMVTDAILGLVG